jgi:hypothetical protein
MITNGDYLPKVACGELIKYSENNKPGNYLPGLPQINDCTPIKL